MSSTKPLDEEAVLVGGRIRSLRKAHGLTLVQLASATAMSQPFLSLVERGHARLSLASLARVARELGVRSDELLAQRPVNRITTAEVDLVPTDHRDRPAQGDRALWQLAQLPGGLVGVEMFGSEPEFTEFAVHTRDEFVYVLAGTLEVSGGPDDPHVRSLGRGDSIAFRAGAAHGWRAPEPTGYRLLIVTAPTTDARP
ncbi:helix-turn-helix domain-containing protein [Subtercola lobariae]|uniref:XRE family transcriptional regulator n=1 Tax=Subtercola lobariae TaxID=1588641 RepID=A0A917BFS1_9MICO|nr:XRE family transcriptional regulator [Subtercola lobariae]GGF40184.1 XRE family transcriptional regulator [Subtercola lobariae]